MPLRYGVALTVMWKAMVTKKYSDPVDYARFMGKYSRCVPTGLSCLGSGETFACCCTGRRAPTRLEKKVLLRVG